MVRIDDHGLVDSHGEFDGIPATDLAGELLDGTPIEGAEIFCVVH